MSINQFSNQSYLMNTLLDYNSTSVRYASLFKRFLAVLLDGIILGIIETICAKFLGHKFGGTLTFFVGIAYFVALETSASQATFGKSALGLRVTDTNGETITAGAAILRYAIKSFVFFISIFLVLFSSRKQALHDIVAGTVVVE
jgi:uncharacterized RDD family membrane protein YckC